MDPSFVRHEFFSLSVSFSEDAVVTRGAPITRAMDIANDPRTLKRLTVWFMKAVSSMGGVTPDIWSFTNVNILSLNLPKRYFVISNHHSDGAYLCFS